MQVRTEDIAQGRGIRFQERTYLQAFNLLQKNPTRGGLKSQYYS